MSVRTPTRADKQRLVALGLDMTEHGGTRSLGVVLHGAADAATLRRHGFTWRVLVDDLAARSARDLAAPAAATTLPSGRTSYRTLADYESEMKALAAQNPGLVRLFTLPNKTWGGKDVIGIEIAGQARGARRLRAHHVDADEPSPVSGSVIRTSST